MKWFWIAVGAGAGFVLGSRTGRGQLDRVVRWSKGASTDLGVSMAADRIAESARAAGQALHESAAARSQSLTSDVADAVTSRLDSVGAMADSAL